MNPQEHVAVFRAAREIVDSVSKIDPLHLEVVIQMREDIEKHNPTLGAEIEAFRYGKALTQVLRVVQKLRDEVIKVMPDDKDGPAAKAFFESLGK